MSKDSGFGDIVEIAIKIIAEVTQGGHRVDRCVWEVEPRIYRIMVDANLPHATPDPVGQYTAYLMGVPLRIVDTPGSGMLLKMVNLQMQE
jgi:hypothetical protein